MKILGGVVKGKRIITNKSLLSKLKKNRLRPTSSKVREALFDILRDRLEDAVFVDLYAGTGIIGLEALSRGAKKVIFVEKDSLRTETIKNAVIDLGFQDQANILRVKVDDFIIHYSGEKVDIFFIDPPYNTKDIERVISIIGDRDILSKRGVVVIEHFFKVDIPEKPGNLIKSRDYRYGDTVLTIYRKAD